MERATTRRDLTDASGCRMAELSANELKRNETSASNSHNKFDQSDQVNEQWLSFHFMNVLSSSRKFQDQTQGGDRVSTKLKHKEENIKQELALA